MTHQDIFLSNGIEPTTMDNCSTPLTTWHTEPQKVKYCQYTLIIRHMVVMTISGGSHPYIDPTVPIMALLTPEHMTVQGKTPTQNIFLILTTLPPRTYNCSGENPLTTWKIKKIKKNKRFLWNSQTSPYATQLEVLRIYVTLTKPNCMYRIPSDNSRLLGFWRSESKGEHILGVVPLNDALGHFPNFERDRTHDHGQLQHAINHLTYWTTEGKVLSIYTDN